MDERRSVEWIAANGYVISARDEPELVSGFLDVVAQPFRDPRLYYRPGGANFYYRGQPMLIGLSGGRVWIRDSMLWWGAE